MSVRSLGGSVFSGNRLNKEAGETPSDQQTFIRPVGLAAYIHTIPTLKELSSSVDKTWKMSIHCSVIYVPLSGTRRKGFM